MYRWAFFCFHFEFQALVTLPQFPVEGCRTLHFLLRSVPRSDLFRECFEAASSIETIVGLAVQLVESIARRAPNVGFCMAWSNC